MATPTGARLAAASAYAAGLRGEKLKTAVAIAMAESSGRPTAHGDVNLHGQGRGSWGLWQVYTGPGFAKGFPRFSDNPKALINPLTNARAMVKISGNGRNWMPWTTYWSKKNSYKAHLGTAAAAVAWVATPAGQHAVKDLLAKGGKGYGVKPPGTGGGKTKPGKGGKKVVVTPATLRADRDRLRGWVKHDLSTARQLVAKIPDKHAGFTKTDPATTADLVAHNTIHAALAETKLVWDEALRLTMQDLDLLAKVLNEGADGYDLTDAELAKQVLGYKDMA